MARLIEIENVIRVIDRYINDDDTNLNIKLAITNIPKIEAEPLRHGHWVHGKELSRDYIGSVCVSIHYDKCWCSECNYPVEGYPLWLYCPNCGARLDEVEE